MRQFEFAVYLGQETEEGFFGFITTPAESKNKNNFFLVLEVASGLTKEEGREIVAQIKEEFLKQTIDNLVGFEDFVNQQLQKHNLPTGSSLASGLIRNDVCYLKTINEGKIFIRRKNNFEKIIDGDRTASGFIKSDDFFIFTTNHFIKLFSQESELKTVFNHKTPHQIIEDLASQIKQADDRGTVALFVQLLKEELACQEEDKDEMIVSQPIFLEKGRSLFKNLYEKFNQYRQRTSKKKTLTLLTAIFLILLLFWSVGLGYNRRKEAQINQKISRSKELITQKLDQAEEVVFLNLPRSQALIGEARIELSNLKKELGGKENKEINEIENLIKEKENKIVNKEEKKAEEFFDLTVDNKQAQGTKLYLNGNELIIFDKKQGIIFNLSLKEKSLEKLTATEIKSASLISDYQENIFFFVKEKGIYKTNQDNKPKLVINSDSDWGTITDFWIYNGNIYLLDTKKDSVYKYLVTSEDKYGDKTDYFKSGEAVKLTEANSLAIDSSLYIGFQDYLAKYTAGVRDQFKTSFPEENVNISKIYTSKDLEKVYGWDKAKGVVYVLGKNGDYERQIDSEVLSKGDDLVVFENSAYILLKEKIYKLSLD